MSDFKKQSKECAQTDSILADDFADFLEAEEEKGKLEELLDVVHKELHKNFVSRTDDDPRNIGNREGQVDALSWVTVRIREMLK